MAVLLRKSFRLRLSRERRGEKEGFLMAPQLKNPSPSPTEKISPNFFKRILIGENNFQPIPSPKNCRAKFFVFTTAR